jgi:hypothetical protein
VDRGEVKHRPGGDGEVELGADPADDPQRRLPLLTAIGAGDGDAQFLHINCLVASYLALRLQQRTLANRWR